LYKKFDRHDILWLTITKELMAVQFTASSFIQPMAKEIQEKVEIVFNPQGGLSQSIMDN
jgi:hypothetical protein